MNGVQAPLTGRGLRSAGLDQVGLRVRAGDEAPERAVEPGSGDHLRVLAQQPVGDEELGAAQADAEVDVGAVAAVLDGEGARAERPVQPVRLHRVRLRGLPRHRADLYGVAVDGAPRATILLQLEVEDGV